MTLCSPFISHLYSLFPYRGMMDENNEQFVAYFLPSASTLTKRSEDRSMGVSYQNDAE